MCPSLTLVQQKQRGLSVTELLLVLPMILVLLSTTQPYFRIPA